MRRKEVEEASGRAAKLPDEEKATVKCNLSKKAQETGIQEEGQQEVEGAYDELSGDEEDEVREEYEDGMQMHHPALWAEIPDDWVPIYRGLNGMEYYRKVSVNVSWTPALHTHTYGIIAHRNGPHSNYYSASHAHDPITSQTFW